ncbi:unnamed protein product [Brassica oleracea]
MFSFTLCMFLCVGTGKVILESAILTTVVVLSLTVYTFWAAKGGYDFNFLGHSTTERPRMCVFRSNKHLYVQVIDDTKMHIYLLLPPSRNLSLGSLNTLLDLPL